MKGPPEPLYTSLNPFFPADSPEDPEPGKRINGLFLDGSEEKVGRGPFQDQVAAMYEEQRMHEAAGCQSSGGAVGSPSFLVGVSSNRTGCCVSSVPAGLFFRCRRSSFSWALRWRSSSLCLFVAPWLLRAGITISISRPVAGDRTHPQTCRLRVLVCPGPR